LCLVAQRSACRGDLVDAVTEAIAAGVDWVQIRERELTGEALCRLIEALRNTAAQRAPEAAEHVKWIVNRRVDVALALQLDGVHLGYDAMEPQQARQLLGSSALIGVSTHSVEEAFAAAQAGADYVHLAPIQPPLSKAAERPALGFSALTKTARAGIPVLAQGGIDVHNAGEAIAAGAAGIAVTGAILNSENPAAATVALRSALDAAA